MMRGQLVSVTRVPAGVEVLSAVAVGAMSIPVLSALDVDEDGGALLLLPDGSTVVVASADHEAATVTLADALAVPLAQGDWLTVPDALEVVATVSVDGEPIEGITVPHELRALLPDRFEQLEDGVTVLFDVDSSGGLSITDVLDSQPVEQWGDEDGAGVTLGPDGIRIFDLDAATAERYDVLARNQERIEEAQTRLTEAEGLINDAFSEIDIKPDQAYVDAAKQQAIDAAAITAQQKADAAKAAAIADAQGKLTTARAALEQAISSGDAAAIADAEQKVLTAKAEAIAAAAVTAQQKADAAQAAAIAVAASDATAKAAEAMTKATAALTAAQSAQATADNAIRTYYGPTRPWADGSAQPDDVLGDMWYDDNTGQAYRWNGTTWTVIVDQTIGQALSAAQSAQTTADGKITAFYQPNEPLEGDEGDLWFDTDAGNHVYRRSGTTWVDVADARITAQATALANVQQDITGLEGTLDGKSNVWVQAAQPTGLGATDKGDIWINNGATPRTTKVWTGTAWIDADSRITQAVTDITKKITTYYTATTTAPTGTFVNGDLWIDINGKIARRSGSSWVTVSDPKALADAALVAAKADATAKADAAREAAKTAAAADATAKAEAAEAAAAATAAADATTKANQAKADAEAAAKTYSDTVASGASGDALAAAKTYADQQADAAELAAKQAAALDATAKAEAAQAEAARLAALDATAKANAAQAAAAAASVPKVDGVGGVSGIRTFREVLNFRHGVSNALGDIVIRTPITMSSMMVTLTMRGYNYVEGRNNLEATVGFYAYAASSTFISKGYTSTGTFPVMVRLGVEGNKVVLVLTPDLSQPRWDHANISIPEVQIGYGTAPLAWAEGWSAEFYATGTLPEFDKPLTSIPKYNPKLALDEAAATLTTVQSSLTGLEGKVDGKANIFVQADAPTGLVAADKGDIWINNGVTPRIVQVWTGSSWVEADSRTTQAVADIAKKTTTFTTTGTTAPAAPAGGFTAGDLWLDVNGKIARWSGAAWVTAVDPKALANAAEQAAKTAAAADATSKAATAEANAKAAAATDAQTKADAAKTAAEAAAKTYSDTVASGAQQAAIDAAKADATAKADAAELAAKQAAAADATSKAADAEAAAKAAAATDAQTKADAALAAAKIYADNAANQAETNAKAFATTRTDGLAKTLWSTALPGTTTAPKDSVWYRHDASGKIIAVFTQTAAGSAGKTWVARPIKSEAIDNLDVGKLTAASGTVNQLVANSFATALASIIKADIGNLTVTGASNLNTVVAERIWGNIASFAEVTADKVLAGDIQAVWNIIAGGKIIAGDPAGARVEITEEGIRIYALGFNGLPYEAVSLINGKISFAVVDQTRGHLAGISAEGDVTGQTGSFGKRLTYKGLDVVGTLDGSAAPGYMDLLPRGILPGAMRTSNTLGGAGSGEVRGIAARGRVLAGRRYRLRGSWLGKTSATDGVIRLRLRYSTDGTLPTTSSPDTGAAPLFRGYTVSVSVGGDIEGFYAPTVDQDLTVLLTHQGLNGSTAQKEWSQVYIEDIGPRALELESGEGEAPKTVYTTSWAATASRGYTKSGATISAKENELDLWYFGAAAESVAILFGGVAATTDNASENGRTIPQALNGATIHSVSFQVTNAMWWNQTIRNMAFGNFAGSALPDTKVIEGSTIVRDIPEGSTVTVNLDPAGFTNGTSQIVTMGDKDGTLSGYQIGGGKFQGPNDPDVPLITFTYSR